MGRARRGLFVLEAKSCLFHVSAGKKAGKLGDLGDNVAGSVLFIWVPEFAGLIA